MSFSPYCVCVCVLLGVDSLRGGLAEGIRIDHQSHVKHVLGRIRVFFTLFGY